MAFSLKSILNDRDVSPRRSANAENHPREPEDTQHNQQDIPTPAQTAEKASKFGKIPPLTPSPQRRALYKRRTSRSAQPDQELATPPSTSEPSSEHDRDTSSPPPHEFDFQGFNIFKALLNHPELVHELSKQLDIESLVSLYAISKDFHDLCDCRFASMILGHANLRAPESAEVFKFKCYQYLCQHDPAKRANLEREGEIRDVPTFRWLRMVESREVVVNGIIRLLAAEGHRLPRRASITIKKLWFTMDIGDSARRVGLFRNTEFWTNKDLYLATMFFIKLDMRFTDPMDGDGETGLRKIILAHRGLNLLYRVLKGEELGSRFDLLRLYVETMWDPAPHHRGKEICGVPSGLVGALRGENWRRGRKNLVQLHELVMSESIHRGLGMEERYLDFLLWGHINPRTFEDIQPLQLIKGVETFDEEAYLEEYGEEEEEEDEEREEDEEEEEKANGEGDGEEGGVEGDSEGGGEGDGEWEDVEDNEDSENSDTEEDDQAMNPSMPV